MATQRIGESDEDFTRRVSERNRLRQSSQTEEQKKKRSEFVVRRHKERMASEPEYADRYRIRVNA